MLDREGLDHLRHAADVVGMGMGGHRAVELGHAQLLQIAHDRSAAFRGARVDQHGLPAREQERRIALTDVNEVNSSIGSQLALRAELIGGIQPAGQHSHKGGCGP